LVLSKTSAPEHRLVAVLDPTAHLVRSLRVHEALDTAPDELGPERLAVTYPGALQTEGGVWRPDAVVVELPDLGWTVTLDITGWEVLPEAPDVFTLSPPPGAQEQDLLTVLGELAAPSSPTGQSD
jgi:hypothetical protein